MLEQAMDAGEYNYAIAFQERIKISDKKMEFYEVSARTYVFLPFIAFLFYMSPDSAKPR